MIAPLAETDRHAAVLAFVQLFTTCPSATRALLQPVLTRFYEATGTQCFYGADLADHRDYPHHRRKGLLGLVLSRDPWPQPDVVSQCWRELSARLPAAVRRGHRDEMIRLSALCHQPVPAAATKTHRPDYLVHFRDSDVHAWMTLHEVSALVGVRPIQVRWQVMRRPVYYTKTKPVLDQSGRSYRVEERAPARDISIRHAKHCTPKELSQYGRPLDDLYTSATHAK